MFPTAGSDFESPDLPGWLACRLASSLPGRAAMSALAPELSYGRHHGPAFASARQAAVLLLLYPQAGAWYLALTVRPDTMSEHGGQVSLPGGVVEAGESSDACACREYAEELGPLESHPRLLGRLSPVWVFVSNFEVTPWVAAVPQRPDFRPNPSEVARVIEMPLALLGDRSARGAHLITRQGLRFRAPHFACQGCAIWGATCMILGEFAGVLSELA